MGRLRGLRNVTAVLVVLVPVNSSHQATCVAFLIVTATFQKAAPVQIAVARPTATRPTEPLVAMDLAALATTQTPAMGAAVA
jgi:hypothetical protein